MSIIYINPQSKKNREKTIVVMGLARSGTSMMATILKTLGVFIGDSLTDGSLEDKEISKLMEVSSNDEALKKIISQRNNNHKIWGWKRPGAFKKIANYENLLRNPFYIFMTRDLAAVSLRRSIAVNTKINDNLSQAQKQYLSYINFISSTANPSLIIPNEVANLDKDFFIESIVEYLGLDSNNEQIKASKKIILPNNNNYLKSMKHNQIKSGRIISKNIENSGFSVINKSSKTSSKIKSVGVLGLAKSNTKTLSKVISDLGVNTETEKLKTIDDQLFVKMIEKSSSNKDVLKYINIRNKSSNIWGFHRPKAVNYITDIEDKFPNPHFILLYNDPCLTAINRSRKIDDKFIEKLTLVARQHKKLDLFLNKVKSPCLIVSHEKAILNPQGFIDLLKQFLDLNPDKKQIQRAIETLKSKNLNKVKIASLSKYIGAVDPIKNGILKGWALKKGDENATWVDITINNKLISSLCVNEERKSLKRKGIGKGNHGFKIDISKYILNKDRLEIFINHKSSQEPLINSPIKYNCQK